MPAKRLPQVLAAADLGSNSFHLVVARPTHGHLEIIDRLKEPVRLAAGLRRDGSLAPEAVERALQCLRRFGEVVRPLPPGAVRAVGTNTFRRARGLAAFLQRAREALGHPIEVISGAEEARLIHAGVVQDLPQSVGRRLVVDIGGGSTEIIVGEGFEVVEATSLFMGCVGFTHRFFPKGRVDRRSWDRAVLAARLELEPWEQRFQSLGWQAAIGSSGTLLAVESILRGNGWTEEGIDRAGLTRLEEAILASGRPARLDLPGLSSNRKAVLAGGVAILRGVVDALDVDALSTSEGALREGLLHDLVGRMTHEDVRDRTVQALVRRFGVDREQAGRVERTALALLAQVAEDWDLHDELPAKVLAWAARLHEVGLAVAYSGHHKHGAYLITHTDLPGFSRGDQALLAALVRFHRRKLVPDEMVPGSTPLTGEALLRLTALLRIAVRLNRSRSTARLPALELSASAERLDLSFPEGWLDARSLTRADLEEEARQLAVGGVRLAVH